MKSAAATLLIIFLTASGCATHATIKHPNLSANLDAQQSRKALNGVDIMARPVHSKSELNAFYDEDLIQYGVLPFHVWFKNNTDSSCSVGQPYAVLTGTDGSVLSPMTLDQVYERASKSYLRTVGWGAAFGLVGAIPSVINVALVNEKIRADYESCMLKTGDLAGNAYTEGSIFFNVDSQITSLDGWKLKIGFKTAETVTYEDFDLAGSVEKREPVESPNKER